GGGATARAAERCRGLPRIRVEHRPASRRSALLLDAVGRVRAAPPDGSRTRGPGQSTAARDRHRPLRGSTAPDPGLIALARSARARAPRPGRRGTLRARGRAAGAELDGAE